MIDDLKLGFRMIKYGLNMKSNLFCAGLFLVLGCIIELVAPNMPIGGMYSALSAMMVVQCIQSVTVCTMVQSSPYKKRLQTTVPAIIGGICIVAVNTIMIGIKLITLYINPFDNKVTETETSNAILYGCGLMIIIMLYMGAAFKLYWPSTIVFFIVFFIYYGGTAEIQFGMMEMIVPLGIAILINYLVMIVGCILMYMLFLFTYKLDYSKVTWEAALRRVK